MKKIKIKKPKNLKAKQSKNLKAKQSKNLKAKKPVNHHDMFFKSFYCEPDFALELFKLIFHKTEFKVYNWKHLKTEKDSLKDKRADLVFSVPLKSYPSLKVKILILLEHKSAYDPQLFSQLLYYQSLLHEESCKKGQAFPIIPVVFYHGKTPWKWAKSFQDTVYKGFLRKTPVRLRRNMINYEIRLLDVHEPKVGRVFKDKSFKSRGALYLLKEIWRLKLTHEDFKKVLAGFSDFSGSRRQGLMQDVSDYLQAVLREGERVKKLWNKAEQELIEQGIYKKGGYMNISEYMAEKHRMKGLRKGRREGRMEGLQEGRMEGLQEGRMERDKEVILNMLKKNLDIKLVSEVTGLSVKEIKKLKNGAKLKNGS